MKGTWGRRVFGTVTKTGSRTRFRLEVKLDNGCTIYETYTVTNARLEQFPKIYRMVCEMLTSRLEMRIKQRHQSWMAE